MAKVIAIKYPPDYDGELHVNAQVISKSPTFKAVSYSFIFAGDIDLSEEQLLLKACLEIAQYLNRKAG